MASIRRILLVAPLMLALAGVPSAHGSAPAARANAAHQRRALDHRSARCTARHPRRRHHRRGSSALRARCRAGHPRGHDGGAARARLRTARPGRGHLDPPARSSGACSDGGLIPSEVNPELIRAATLCLVNRERTAHGEQPLRVDARLQSAAQGHTDSMIRSNYFEHVGPAGDTPLIRARQAGYIPASFSSLEIGENIAWGTHRLSTPLQILAGWMASAGHRANILNARFRDSGIGVSARLPFSLAGGQGGGIYTEDFGYISR